MPTLRISRFIAGLLLALCMGGAAAGPYSAQVEQAKAFASGGKADEAFAILRPLAEKGDAEAQFALAEIQLRPQWRNRDPADGAKWLTRAAEQGHVMAQFELGRYYAGEGRNYPEAMKWYLKAAEHLDERPGQVAAENIGIMYAFGQGVAVDKTEAARWVGKAAERGSASAQYRAGLIHLEGAGVPRDAGQGIAWLAKAAEQRYEPARLMLVFTLAEGIRTQPSAMDAARWIAGRRPPDEGMAAYLLGKFYWDGFTVWPEESGILHAVYRNRGLSEDEVGRYLKQMYGQRWGDVETALRWYRAGAESGFIGAQVNLAGLLLRKDLPYRDCGEAMKWMRVAVGRGDRIAMGNLGQAYLQGPDQTIVAIGVELDGTEGGVKVAGVAAGKPAQRAGLQAGDRIVSLNGQDAEKLGMTALIERIRASKGRPLQLSVRREGESAERQLSVTPEEEVRKCPGAEEAGLRRDPAEAMRWFEKAAELGDNASLFYLAGAYRKGDGVAQDLAKAVELYKRGVQRDDWESAQALSHLYSAGEGVPKDAAEANRWMRTAIDLKHKAVRGR